MLLSALMLLAGSQAMAINPRGGGDVVAPRHPRGLEMRKPRSRTSRVRGWTVEQRRCEKRTEGACVMTAPDLVQAEADKPRDRD